MLPEGAKRAIHTWVGWGEIHLASIVTGNVVEGGGARKEPNELLEMFVHSNKLQASLQRV